MKAKIGYGSKDNLLPNIASGIFDEGDIIFTSDSQELAFIRPDKTPMYVTSRENTTFDSPENALNYIRQSKAVYSGQVISVLNNGSYTLYIVKFDTDSMSYNLQEVNSNNIIWGTLPESGQKENVIYIDNLKGYIWNGSEWKVIFEDASSKADLISPNFSGTPTIDSKPIATQEWMTENLQNELQTRIGDLGEYATVVEYIDSKISESQVTKEDLDEAVTECNNYSDSLLTIVEF